jgi:hypothetical protein
LLAVVHGKLGDAGRAWQWYDSGVTRRAAGPIRDPDLERLRAEAAELLGVKEAAPP